MFLVRLINQYKLPDKIIFFENRKIYEFEAGQNIATKIPVQKRLTISEAGSTSATSIGPSREVKSSWPRREHFMALLQADSVNFPYADLLLFLAASYCYRQDDSIKKNLCKALNNISNPRIQQGLSKKT